MQPLEPREILRFRDFELDVAGYELRRHGRPLKLGRQPMDLLILLVESRRQLVSRSDIVDRLWGKDVFVDVETGVNTAISKVRQALRDSPEAPAFVETVPGKGYRFIADVEVVSAALDGRVPPLDSPASALARDRPRSLEREPVRAPEQTSGVTSPAPSAVTATATEIQDAEQTRAAPAASTRGGADLPMAPRARTRNPPRLAIAVGLVAMLTGLAAWAWLSGGATGSRVTLAVLPFVNIGSDPEREYLAAGLTEETSASLAQIDPERLSVKGRTLRYKGTTKSAIEIGRELSVDYLVESVITAEGARIRVTVKLIRVRDQEHVWSESYEREQTSLLGLQQELSTAIAGKIRVRLSPDQAGGSGGGRRRMGKPTLPISKAGVFKAGGRRRPTRTRSSSTSARSPSTRATRWPGPAWQ